MAVDTARTPWHEGAAALRGDVVSCWMCGTHQHSSQMLADGGAACDDIRWYCKDPQACTERWITARRQARTGGAVPPGGSQSG